MIWCYADSVSCGYTISQGDRRIIEGDGSFGNEEHVYFGVCKSNSHCNDGNPCTVDTCHQNICVFRLDCSKCNKGHVSVHIKTDNASQDTNWVIINLSTRDMIASGGRYA